MDVRIDKSLAWVHFTVSPPQGRSECSHHHRTGLHHDQWCLGTCTKAKRCVNMFWHTNCQHILSLILTVVFCSYSTCDICLDNCIHDVCFKLATYQCPPFSCSSSQTTAKGYKVRCFPAGVITKWLVGTSFCYRGCVGMLKQHWNVDWLVKLLVKVHQCNSSLAGCMSVLSTCRLNSGLCCVGTLSVACHA